MRARVALFCSLALSALVLALVPVARAGNPAITRGLVADLPVGAVAAVFTAALTTQPRSSAMRLTIAVHGTDSVVSVRIAPVGTGTTYTLTLNDGTALTAGRLYTFSWGAHSDHTYNVVITTSTTVAHCLVDEIRDGSL